jgi:hypothetical protein
MLSFEIVHQDTAIRISCDEEGMGNLIKALERVRADGDHIHLRMPADSSRNSNEKNPWGEKTIYDIILNWTGS